MTNILDCVTKDEDGVELNVDFEIEFNGVKFTDIHLYICDPDEFDDFLEGNLELDEMSIGDLGIGWITGELTDKQISKKLNDFYYESAVEFGGKWLELKPLATKALIDAGMDATVADSLMTTEHGMQDSGRVSCEGQEIAEYILKLLKEKQSSE